MSDSFNAQIVDYIDATINRGASNNNSIGFHGQYFAECFDANGDLKWSDTIDNLTTNVGRASINDVYLGQSLVSPATVILGLWVNISAGAPAVTDTMTSHPGWKEIGNANAPTYTVATFGIRGVPTFGASTNANPAVKATSSPVSYLITSAGPSPIDGAFLVVGGTTAIDNTTGILFSAGAFAAGTKTVTSGDTISVSYQLSTS